MKKYIEFGLGNKWLVRTEIEKEDGTEKEVKGIQLPIQIYSIYVRIWIGKRVIIVDTKEGLKTNKKNTNRIKLIFGISGK